MLPPRQDNAIERGSAFTLAEVLITLGIIGIVAALTIPQVITKYQKKIAITRLKKAYNVLTVATQSSISENGPVSSWNYALQAVDGKLADNYFFKYTNTQKKVIPSYKLHYANGHSGMGIYNDTRTFYVAPDGMQYWLYSQCARSSSNTPYPFCTWAYIFVDIDGDGKKNQMGRDVFVFHVNYNNDKKPMIYFNTKAPDEELKTGCSKGTTGDYLTDLYNWTSCLDIIVKNDWNFPDYYPW